MHELMNQVASRGLQTTPSSRAATASAGQSLLFSMLAEAVQVVPPSTRQAGTYRDLLDELPPAAQTRLPGRDAAGLLIKTYFEHCEFFSPIIASQNEFEEALRALYDQEEDQHPRADVASGDSDELIVLRFRILLIFATSVLLLNRTDSSFPVSQAEGYFAAAMTMLRNHNATIYTRDIEHLYNISLLVQYSCFDSNLSAAWHFLGLATRLAVELGLHCETRSNEDESAALPASERSRWLFWAIYTFERNLCVVLGRPFSIPDGAIRSPPPFLTEYDSNRAFAIHLIRCRRLESEVYTTLYELPPMNGAVLDLNVWRESMQQRLLEWRASTPASLQLPTQLAPVDIFDGLLQNLLVLLRYPSPAFPSPSDQDLVLLAQSAVESITCYKRAFRDGHLRFYWRTIHNLFRSGVAAAYCLRARHLRPDLELDASAVATSINTCVSILWGMVERYPPGKVYRDVFDHLATSVLRLSKEGSTESELQRARVEPLHFPADITQAENGNLPSAAFDAIYWAFQDSN